MKLSYLDDSNFELEIVQTPGVAVVLFYAYNTLFTDSLNSLMEEVAEGLGFDAMAAMVNISTSIYTAEKYSVTQTPMTIIFKDGKEQIRLGGHLLANRLLKLVQSYIYEKADTE